MAGRTVALPIRLSADYSSDRQRSGLMRPGRQRADLSGRLSVVENV